MHMGRVETGTGDAIYKYHPGGSLLHIERAHREARHVRWQTSPAPMVRAQNTWNSSRVFFAGATRKRVKMNAAKTAYMSGKPWACPEVYLTSTTQLWVVSRQVYSRSYWKIQCNARVPLTHGER